MAYWPGNVRHYATASPVEAEEEEPAVEFLCRFCCSPFHSQGMLDKHERRCPVGGEEEGPSPGPELATLRPIAPDHTPTSSTLQASTPASSPTKPFAFKPGVAVKTVVVGSGGKVVRKIILRAPASAAAAKLPHFPPHHRCPTCQRTFARADHFQHHMKSFHGSGRTEPTEAESGEGGDGIEIDVISHESPEKPAPIDLQSQLAAEDSNTPSSSANTAPINWDELSGKKVNYPIALKKIPIGKRTGGKFWRTPTLKSGLPLVLKVVGGSGMEELSEEQKPLFCSQCRFLFKTTKEMRAHVVSTHLVLLHSSLHPNIPFINVKNYKQESPMGGGSGAEGMEERMLEEEEGDEDAQVEVLPQPIPQPQPQTQPGGSGVGKAEPSPRRRAKRRVAAVGESEEVADEDVASSASKLRFGCEECQAEFKSRENIVEHLRKVHRQRMMHQCSKCDKFFSAKAKLNRHEQVHLKLETGPSAYECDYCGKQFVYESYLRRHRASHTGEKFYTCPHCGEHFRSQGRLVIHKATAHEGGGGVSSLYQCDRCGKTFPYKSYLDRHVKTHISDIPKSCPHCNQVFKVESSLQKHIYKEHEGRGLLPCPHCDKKFLYPSYLERHQSVHSANREHQCPMCNKRFSLRGTLLDHLKSHLPSSDDVLPKSSTCMICNNRYRHEANLERHMQQMHPHEWMSSLYEEVPDARFEETVETATTEEEDVRVEYIHSSDYPTNA